MNKQEKLKTKNVLETFLRYSNDIIICLATDFTVTEINNSAEKFYGWPHKKVYSKDFLQLCKSSGYTCPITSDFFKKATLLNINLDTKNSANKQCNIDWVICPILLADNNVDGAVLIGKNIELKKSNIAYHLNEIINCIPGCLYWKDCNGHYLGCNELTAKLAGLNSIYDIAGKTDQELWGKQADWLITHDNQVITSGKTIIVEETLQAADGRWLYFTGVKMPLKDENNNIIGIIGNSLDITELKTTQAELKESKEKAEALSKIKSEFIANMSHDVKTPLSGIIGLSETLLDMLKEKEHDLAQSIFLSGQQLMNFFDNCIDMAKAEDANIVLVKEHFNLKFLLEQIIALFQPAVQNKGLALSLHYDNKIPELLLGSRASIYRIVLNLVGNAIKFTHQGSVSIHAKLSKKATKKHAVIQLAVEDTGIGIPKDKQKIIFEHFTRLVPSYKGIYEGSGIGLHLVEKFVNAMQGEIHVASEEGKGSRFLVVLPLEISLLDEKDILNALPDYAIPRKKHFKKIKTIKNQPGNHKKLNEAEKILSLTLLVEDNPVAQKIAQLMLAHFSHQVDLAESGEKALGLFEPGKYDLVLMDVGLPDIAGPDVTKILRKMESGTS